MPRERSSLLANSHRPIRHSTQLDGRALAFGIFCQHLSTVVTSNLVNSNSWSVSLPCMVLYQLPCHSCQRRCQCVHCALFTLTGVKTMTHPQKPGVGRGMGGIWAATPITAAVYRNRLSSRSNIVSVMCCTIAWFCSGNYGCARCRRQVD